MKRVSTQSRPHSRRKRHAPFYCKAGRHTIRTSSDVVYRATNDWASGGRLHLWLQAWFILEIFPISALIFSIWYYITLYFWYSASLYYFDIIIAAYSWWWLLRIYLTKASLRRWLHAHAAAAIRFHIAASLSRLRCDIQWISPLSAMHERYLPLDAQFSPI